MSEPTIASSGGRKLPEDDDYITFKYIPAKTQESELMLFGTKWFDYRMLTPLQATRLYVSKYEPAYRKIYARYFDRTIAEYIKVPTLDALLLGVAGNDRIKKAQFTAMWHGRQCADLLGMPYEEYIPLAFEYRLRLWKRNTMPQPQHLYHEYDVEKVQARWEEMKKANIYTAEEPAYMIQNYCGAAHQNAYIEWLFEQASSRHDTDWHLAQFVRNDQLDVDRIKLRLGDATLESVMSHMH